MEEARGAVVIGAGPYGLSAAAHLAAKGCDPVVFGRTMASWKEAMPAGMLLRSEIAASDISTPATGAKLADWLDGPIGEDGFTSGDVPVEQFVEYGTWFAAEHVPEVREDGWVTNIEQRDGAFHVDLHTGEHLRAQSVVVATGHRMHTHWPTELELAAVTSPRVTHASEHTNLAMFSGCRVAVVGAGQSALETAALLHEFGASPVLISRVREIDWDLPPHRPTFVYRMRRPLSGLGPGWPKRILERHAEVVRPMPTGWRLSLLKNVLGPSGACWLRERVEPHVEIHTRSQVASAEAAPDQVRLEIAQGDGTSTTLEVDHVIAATGYRFDIDRLDFLAAELRNRIQVQRGYPRLTTNLESSVSGLFFAGLPAGGTFGPVMRFVCGTEFASPRIARTAARAVSHAV